MWIRIMATIGVGLLAWPLSIRLCAVFTRLIFRKQNVPPDKPVNFMFGVQGLMTAVLAMALAARMM